MDHSYGPDMDPARYAPLIWARYGPQIMAIALSQIWAKIWVKAMSQIWHPNMDHSFEPAKAVAHKYDVIIVNAAQGV